MKSPRVAAAGWQPPLAHALADTRLFSQPVCLVGVGAEGRQLSAVTPDAPPLQLPLELVAQGLQLRFDREIDGNIFEDVHVMGAMHAMLRLGVAELLALLELFREAPHDAQVGTWKVGGVMAH